MPLSGDQLISVHFIPHVSLAGATDIDLLLAANQNDMIQPFYSDYSVGRTFNLDGFLSYRPTGAGSNFSYLQIYRNGILESVTSGLLADRERSVMLPSLAFAEHLGSFIQRARLLMRTLGIEPPASVYVSLLGARGAELGVNQRLTMYGDHHPRSFDRDNMLLRELFLTGWEEEPTHALLKPLLDELWQASGFPRCFDYNNQGEWKPMRS